MSRKRKVKPVAAQQQPISNPVPEHLKPHVFRPGQSGNPTGRPKGLTATGRMRELAREIFDAETGLTYRDALVESMYRTAIGGDVQAMKLVIERLDGRTPEAIEEDRQEATDPGLAEALRKAACEYADSLAEGA